MSKARSLNQGFAMLEVLIAILVVSFGLIGLAGLQLIGLKNDHASYMRSIATQQAYDMADRMRVNMTGVTGGSYDNIPAAPGTGATCVNTACSAANMALYDQFQWNTTNALLLPSGGGTVTVGATTPNKFFIITINWSEKCDPHETGCATDGTVTRYFNTTFEL